MASKCGCSGDACSCKIVGGRGTRVTGSGNINNPYVIDAFPISLVVMDTVTINLSLSGSGLESDPWVISADTQPGLLDGYWKIWQGTQAEYDALGSYDDDTLYVILED